jgi:hypothetical protein
VGLVAVLGAAAMGAASLVHPDAVDHGPVLCPFRLLTGLPCPGCGLTRSWVHLMHGQLSAATAANPFGLVALLTAVALLGVVAGSVVRRRPIPTWAELGAGAARLPRSAAIRATGGVVLAGWLGFGVARMLLAALS